MCCELCFPRSVMNCKWIVWQILLTEVILQFPIYFFPCFSLYTTALPRHFLRLCVLLFSPQFWEIGKIFNTNDWPIIVSKKGFPFLLFALRSLVFWVLHFFIFLLFIFEWETECKRRRSRERDTHRIRSRLQALSCQHRARHRVWTTNCEITTWAEVGCSINWATQASQCLALLAIKYF